jgi:aquaporin Z
MLSACAFTVFLFDPSYPALHLFPSAVFRRTLMGVAMGVTVILIIRSPMGKRFGAHFNPAITLTYFRLRKIARWDALFYVVFPFMGGAGVAVAAIWFGNELAKPTVEYAITVPGPYGTVPAFFAELFMATLLMAVVLRMTNRPSLATYTIRTARAAWATIRASAFSIPTAKLMIWTTSRSSTLLASYPRAPSIRR